MQEKTFSQVSDLLEEDLDFLTNLRECAISDLPGGSQNKEQAIRRLYIRMLVSTIEGALSTFRQEALNQSHKFSQGELALLQEASFEVTDAGKVVTKQAHTPFFASFRFSFRMLAKAWDSKLQPDYSGDGWQALQHTVRLRNRLTHPKCVEDLSVLEADMKSADTAEIWFRLAHSSLLKERVPKMEALLKRVRGEVAITSESEAAQVNLLASPRAIDD